MRRHVTTCTLLAAAALTLGFAATPPGSAAPGPKHIANSAPGWLAHGKKIGTPSPNAAVSARIYLAPNGGLAALASAAQAVSTRGSASYGKFLSAAQYHAQFDPTAQTVSAVRSWLESAGLKIDGQGAYGSYLDISGTVAAAQNAFATTIATYSHDGMTVQAPDGSLSAPDAIAGNVLAVSGLDTTPMLTQPQTQRPSPPDAGFRNSKVCSQWYGGPTEAPSTLASLPVFNNQAVPYSVCGYTGPQLRGAYEGPTTLDGSGVTVAIVDAYASGTIESDANKYATLTGDQPFTSGQFTQSWPNSFTQVNSNKSPKQCGASGWYGEETLDVEAVHAMAPGANVRYYAASSCNDQDLLDAFSRINNEDTAQIVSNSWGSAGDLVKSSLLGAYDQAFLQGAVEGISYLFSSGDAGDEAAALGSPQTDYPASDPYVTAVGGTSTEITQAGIKAETGWQTSKYALNSTQDGWSLVSSFLYGGGGGYSNNIKEPQYQIDAGIQSPNGGRAVPDVAMDGDPTTGMLIGQTQTFPDGVYFDTYRIGGTSLASPLFAGMTALKIQATQQARGNSNGLGLLNPMIYKDHSGFADVTGAGMDPGSVRVDYANGLDSSAGLVYTLRTFNGATSTQKVGPGWDSETGWGSARAGWLTPAP